MNSGALQQERGLRVEQGGSSDSIQILGETDTSDLRKDTSTGPSQFMQEVAWKSPRTCQLEEEKNFENGKVDSKVLREIGNDNREVAQKAAVPDGAQSRAPEKRDPGVIRAATGGSANHVRIISEAVRKNTCYKQIR